MNVGDKCIVKKGLEPFSIINGVTILPEMAEMGGSIFRVDLVWSEYTIMANGLFWPIESIIPYNIDYV